MRACNLWIPVSKLGFQCRTGNNIKMHATLSLLWEPRDSFSIRLNFRIFNDTHTKTICHAPPHRLLRTCHPLLRTCPPPLLRTCALRLTRNHLMHTWQPVCGSENYGNQGKSTNSFIQKCICHCIYTMVIIHIALIRYSEWKLLIHRFTT